jgi:mono/diheme cytochrome c family protein
MFRTLTCTAAFIAAAVLTTQAQEAKVQKGAQVFAAQKCSLCHSIAGKGNAKGSLDGVGLKHDAATIREWVTDPVGMTKKSGATRKPPMPKKALPADDVEALVAYLQTLKSK